MKNLRFDFVTQWRNLTTDGKECGDNFSCVRYAIVASKICVLMTSYNGEISWLTGESVVKFFRNSQSVKTLRFDDVT